MYCKGIGREEVKISITPFVCCVIVIKRINNIAKMRKWYITFLKEVDFPLDKSLPLDGRTPLGRPTEAS